MDLDVQAAMWRVECVTNKSLNAREGFYGFGFSSALSIPRLNLQS